uniref:Uncharacterized protein n=1 Tax=Anopheles merus TaxID=30066 RepID=A0A182VI60_ANOME
MVATVRPGVLVMLMVGVLVRMLHRHRWCWRRLLLLLLMVRMRMMMSRVVSVMVVVMGLVRLISRWGLPLGQKVVLARWLLVEGIGNDRLGGRVRSGRAAQGTLMLEVVYVLVMVRVGIHVGRHRKLMGRLVRILQVVPYRQIAGRPQLAIIVREHLLRQIALQLELVHLLRHDALVHVLPLLENLFALTSFAPIDDGCASTER